MEEIKEISAITAINTGRCIGAKKPKIPKDTHVVRPILAVLELNVGLLFDPVQVLVEPVEEEGEQLLRVLLLVAGELRREPPHRHLEVPRDDVRVAARPDALDELAEGARDLALHSQRVVLVDVFGIVVVGKVFGDWRTVREALKPLFIHG